MKRTSDSSSTWPSVPPKFKRAEQFQSIVWKQGGFKLNANVFVVNSIKQQFQFSYSRPYEGKVKQVRIKRLHLGDYCLYIVTDAVAQPCRKSHDGASVGVDFGLKTYLTLSNGTRVENPLFLKKGLNDLRRASRRLSGCAAGSSHRKAARLNLDRFHEDITHKRDDWQWKLSHELCRAYDTLCIEDLQLTGMTRLMIDVMMPSSTTTLVLRGENSRRQLSSVSRYSFCPLVRV